MRPWYKDFFDEFYLRSYKNIVNKKRTLKEVNFVEKTLKLQKGARILDLCCGNGRHAIELAKRGYVVTAQDLNKDFLKLAAREAKKENVQIRFVCKDMRDIPFQNEFGAIFNIFTSFGYLESSEEDFKVIQQVAKALKTGGKFLLDIRNRDWILANFQYKDWRIVDGLIVLEERYFDSFSGKVITQVIYIEKGKIKKTTEHSARLYNLPEINEMLKKVGLEIQKVYGGLDFEEYTAKSQRMIILSLK